MKRATYAMRNRSSINRQRRRREQIKSIRRLQRERRIVFYFQEQDQNA